MMFEQFISVFNRVADTFERIATALETAAPAVTAETKAPEAEKPKATRTKKEAPASTPAPEATPAKTEEPAAAETALNPQILQNAALGYIKRQGVSGEAAKAAVEAVLAPYGVSKIRDLDPSHYEAVHTVFITESEEF
jgi:hypothetical protein